MPRWTCIAYMGNSQYTPVTTIVDFNHIQTYKLAHFMLLIFTHSEREQIKVQIHKISVGHIYYSRVETTTVSRSL